MPKIVRTQVEFEGQQHEQVAVVEEELLEPWTDAAALSIVGRATPRVDGREKVTGKAQYTADIELPGMLYARILRCPHPHARLTRLETARAEKAAGVFGVLSHVNAPRIPWHNDSFLFDTTLRYQGDEVAAVAAVDEETAARAAGLIQASYAELPFVSNLEQALLTDAPAIRPGGNVIADAPGSVYERGDVDGTWRTAHVVMEGVFETQRAVQNPWESHGSVAWWQDDLLTIWDSTQSVFSVRDEVAAALGLPLHRIRIVGRYFGGGFGSKQSVSKQAVIAALLSRSIGRPVKLMLGRSAESLAGGCRSATRQALRLGAKKDGTLVAISLEAWSDIGAYGTGPMALGGPVRELYRCPNVRAVLYAVYTNTGPSAAFRGPGYTEGTFALESMLDRLATVLDMDPLELRLKNYATMDPQTGKRYSLKTLDRAYRRGAEAIGWHRRAVAGGRAASGRRRGIGMASQIWGGGGGPPAYTIVKVSRDGTAQLLTGTQDIGTGTRTALCQIAAEELGFRLADVAISLGDTQSAPFAPVSAGSMTIASMGPAVRVAARNARQQLAQLASELLQVSADDVVLGDGQIRSRSGQWEPVPVKRVTGELGDFTVIGLGARGPNPSQVKVRTFGAQFAEVEVDLSTGAAEVLQLVAVHDCGLVINPLTARSQVQGGLIQGLGYGLLEEQIVDGRFGLVLNADLEGYKIPTALDVPEIHVQLQGIVDPEANSIGAKGLGEPPIIPTAPAIANAIYNVIGVSPSRLPITRAEVLRLSAE
ncbi:MAG: xanthine dehydrogenase family protein molybdopterin-binding subunit [Chloroflexota bacterium]|nr:MAG: xanthine dehydrogenase family protein molybdopterin-binding subunit [Chloroflexota bacterium]